MKKSRDFNDILDECLERLVKGGTIEECLASYPDLAAELEPLLQTAVAVRQASVIQPHPDFRAKARYQFHSALQAMESKKSRSFFGWQRRWVTAVTVVFVLLLAGGGTVAAASNSMPDNPLYPVKLATEQVQLILTPSDIGKARLCLRLADRRVAEIVYIANKNKPEQVENVIQRLDNHLVMIASLISGQRKDGSILMVPSEQAGVDNDVHIQANGRVNLRIMIASYAINHPAALRAALEKSPDSVKPALRRAIAISVAGYEKALMALD
ncbi:MAG TPA: hypothetical protein G4N93_04840 [Dehalococcoidia bacterium]|nr:hypothetical protein [Dehalococcoidia bacterium]